MFGDGNSLAVHEDAVRIARPRLQSGDGYDCRQIRCRGTLDRSEPLFDPFDGDTHLHGGGLECAQPNPDAVFGDGSKHRTTEVHDPGFPAKLPNPKIVADVHECRAGFRRQHPVGGRVKALHTFRLLNPLVQQLEVACQISRLVNLLLGRLPFPCLDLARLRFLRTFPWLRCACRTDRAGHDCKQQRNDDGGEDFHLFGWEIGVSRG